MCSLLQRALKIVYMPGLWFCLYQCFSAVRPRGSGRPSEGAGRRRADATLRVCFVRCVARRVKGGSRQNEAGRDGRFLESHFWWEVFKLLEGAVGDRGDVLRVSVRVTRD